MRRTFTAPLLLATAMLTACADDPSARAMAPPELAVTRSAIINGEPDERHPAVVALLGPEHACSATIVGTDPPELYLLTAAHCVEPHAPSAPTIAVGGASYEDPEAIFDIVSCRAHPSYDGELFDFAMCRATGATDATPVIPPVTAPDGLATGSQVLHVGYGVTEHDGYNSTRYAAVGHLTAVEPLLIWYDQAVAGPCSGDSGGPQLSASEPERIVGVTSFGDVGCTEVGASGRVAAVHDTFIAPFIAEAQAAAGSCASCVDAATSSLGTCSVALEDCLGDESCRALYECVAGCETESCRTSCAELHQRGRLLYAGIVSCVCVDACATQCADDPACAPGGGDGGAAGGAAGGGGGGGGSSAEPKADEPSSRDRAAMRADRAPPSCSARPADSSGDARPSVALLLALAAAGLMRRQRLVRGLASARHGGCGMVARPEPWLPPSILATATPEPRGYPMGRSST